MGRPNPCAGQHRGNCPRRDGQVDCDDVTAADTVRPEQVPQPIHHLGQLPVGEYKSRQMGYYNKDYWIDY